jgi:hypothetical protein
LPQVLRKFCAEPAVFIEPRLQNQEKSPSIGGKSLISPVISHFRAITASLNPIGTAVSPFQPPDRASPANWHAPCMYVASRWRRSAVQASLVLCIINP